MIEIKHRITGKVLKTVDAYTLRNANLYRANLEGANLRGANLYRASLEGADLDGADLRGADLDGAILYRASLEGADLVDTNIYRANLEGANLRGVDLEGADLIGSNLYGAKNILQWQSAQGEKRICYSVKHQSCIMHKLGCFWGNTEKAVKAIREKYGDNSMYEQLLMLNTKALESE